MAQSDTPYALNERTEKTNYAIMSNSTKVLKKGAGKEVGGVGCERGTGAAGTARAKVIRRRKEKAQASSNRKLTRGQREGWRLWEAREPMASRGMRGTDKGTKGSRRTV